MTEKFTIEKQENPLVLDVAQVIALEQAIDKAGTPLAELMDRAGRSAAQVIIDRYTQDKRVVIFCGTGNNGGDGWVCAAELASKGRAVSLITPCAAEKIKTEPARSAALRVMNSLNEVGRNLSVIVMQDQEITDTAECISSGHAKTADHDNDYSTGAMLQTTEAKPADCDNNYSTGAMLQTPKAKPADHDNDYSPGAMLQTPAATPAFNDYSPGAMLQTPEATSAFHEAVNRADIVVDAMLGTGFSSETLRSPYKEWTDKINAEKQKRKDVFILAIDVPSGLSAQTGVAAATCIKADLTLTMIVCKPGLLTDSGKNLCGETLVSKIADITPYLK